MVALLCFSVSSAWAAYLLEESFNTNEQTNTYESNHFRIVCAEHDYRGMILGGSYQQEREHSLPRREQKALLPQ